MSAVPLTIGITAHRDLCADELPAIRQATRDFFLQLRHRFPATPLRLLSPLAEGGSRLVAEIAVEMGIELVVPLPFGRDEYRKDFPQPDLQQSFDRLLARATSVIELEPAGDYSSEEIAAGGKARDAQYANLGVFMSDRCQILIAIWDGKPLKYPGGTSQVVNYHQFGQMRGVDGGLDRPKVLAEDDTDLVYHIVCSRDRDDGGPAPGLSVGQTRYLISELGQREVRGLPARYVLMIERLGEYNRDVAALCPDLAPNPDDLPGWSEALNERDALNEIAVHFARSDYLARYFQRRFMLALKTLVTLGLVATTAFVAYADLDLNAMIYLFLVAFSSAMALYALADRRQWHRKYLDSRALAEGLRVQFYWRLAGVSGRYRNDFAHDNFLQKQDLEIGWIRNVMRHVGLIDANLTDSSRVDEVCDYWVGKDASSGQLGFFRSRADRMSRRTRRTRQIIGIALWLGVGAAVVLALFQNTLSDAAIQGLLVMIGLLSVGAAVRELYANKTAEAELVKQYNYMYRVYRDARAKLDDCETALEKLEILRILGEAALDEHAEWIQRHRERPLEAGGL